MTLRFSASTFAPKQIQPLVKFIRCDLHSSRRKDKVVFVVGPTGTGKSKLAIDLATRFPGEVINSDKIQIHKGLEILTNKVTKEESRDVRHHLIGAIDPLAHYTCDDFRYDASNSVKSIISRDRLPIIAGGSNSFIEALACNDAKFRANYDCCFLWVNVSRSVLNNFVSDRVDRMVKSGLLEEVREFFDPEVTDYSQGIRRAIGVPELDFYFRNEGRVNFKTLAMILDAAIAEIKKNTCVLADRQLKKIKRLQMLLEFNMYHIDATEVLEKKGLESEKAWKNRVAEPSARIVEQFLCGKDRKPAIEPAETAPVLALQRQLAVAAAATVKKAGRTARLNPAAAAAQM